MVTGEPKNRRVEASERLTAAQVKAYLRRNPNFLAVHPDLLDVLAPPRRDLGEAGGLPVEDLQQHMLAQARADAAQAKERLAKLVVSVRDNLKAQTRMQAAVVAMMAARNLDHLIEIVSTDLAVVLDLDAVVLAIEGGEVPRVTAEGVHVLPPGYISHILGAKSEVVLNENITGDKRLYGSAAGLVHSEALLRLRVRKEPPDAVLALGIRHPYHFNTGHATEALGFLGQVTALSIRSWLGLQH